MITKTSSTDRLWYDPHYEGLMVNWDCKHAPTSPHDVYIEDRLNRLISQDERIAQSDRAYIRVRVRHGLAWLTGLVSQPLSIEYAYRDAMTIDDLEDVISELSVRQHTTK